MSFLSFLKYNAMQISGLLSATLTIVFAFTHLSAAQVAALVGGPAAIGNFLVGMAITRQNGNGKVVPSPSTAQPVKD